MYKIHWLNFKKYDISLWACCLANMVGHTLMEITIKTTIIWTDVFPGFNIFMLFSVILPGSKENRGPIFNIVGMYQGREFVSVFYSKRKRNEQPGVRLNESNSNRRYCGSRNRIRIRKRIWSRYHGTSTEELCGDTGSVSALNLKNTTVRYTGTSGGTISY